MAMITKKEQILNAAVAIMEQKGPQATISEIARAAGVNDSVIYHYFQDKEDLMFHTIGAYVKNRSKDFLARLETIEDPVRRLRKLIWEQLHYHEVNPNYTKFTIFYCRSKKSFFRHESFVYHLNWARILRIILEDGVRAKHFSADLPVRVARDIILGFLDIENIQYFTGHRTKSIREDINEILKMITLMITDFQGRVIREKDKRKRILTIAEDIFAKKDYHTATTSEIARLAHVSEATLYQCFANKEDILLSGLQYRLRRHLNIAESFFDKQTPLSRLVRFIYYHFTMYFREPSFVKNFILNGIFNPNFYSSEAYVDFQDYMAIVDKILEDGKACGSFRADLDNRLFQYLFIGAFSHTALRWLLTDDDKRFEMLGRLQDITDLLIKIVVRPANQ